MQTALFYILGTSIILLCLAVVRGRNPVYCAGYLILAMFLQAGIFALLGAPFLAAIQVLIYAGAIMVLFLFVIMLLNAGVEERTRKSKLVRGLGLPLFALLLCQLAYLVYRGFGSADQVQFGKFIGSTAQIGRALFRDYVLPFEVTSVLILVAILGAVVLARKEIS